MFVLPDLLNEAVLVAALRAVCHPGGVGNSMQLHLYTNDFTPTAKSKLADFTELTSAQLPGLVLPTASWQVGRYRLPDGGWSEPPNTDIPAFVATLALPGPVTCYGWFATQSFAPTVLVGSGRFVVPFTFAAQYDACVLPARWDMPSQISPRSLDILLPDFQPL